MSKQYCEKCGMEVSDSFNFCDNCGVKVRNHKEMLWLSKLKIKTEIYSSLLSNKIKYMSPLKVLGVLFLIVVFFIIFNFYKSYEQTQQVVLKTSQQLEETKIKLNDITSSATKKLITQEQEISQKIIKF